MNPWLPPEILEAWSVYAISALCVAAFAWERFKKPEIWRAMTTPTRWRVAHLGYVTGALALWAVLTRLISAHPETVGGLLIGSSERAEKLVTAAAAPFGAALLLSVLLPNVPKLRTVDEAIQNLFRWIGAIPHNAEGLSGELFRAPLVVSDDDEEEVRRVLKDQGLDDDAVMAAREKSLEHEWLRIVVLQSRQRQALDDSALIPHQRDARRQADDSYRILSALAPTIMPPDGAAEPAQEKKDFFKEQVRQLHHGLTLLVSCGMLRAHDSGAKARGALREWGFAIEEAEAPPIIGLNDAVGVGVLAVCYMLFISLVLGFFDKDPGRAVSIAAAVGGIMVAAVICAGVPRRLFSRPEHAPPGTIFWAEYFAAAILAAAAWLLIHLANMVVLSGTDVQSALEKIWTIRAFIFVPASLAFVIALLLDFDVRRIVGAGLPARAAEASLLAAVLGCVAYLAGSVASPGGVEPETMAMNIAGLAFVLGFVVPHLYRRLEERRGFGAAPAGAAAGVGLAVPTA